MEKHDTRGILRPEAVGEAFNLRRWAPPDDLAAFVDGHWEVTWDLRGRPPFRSEVLPHPAVHVVFEEPGGAKVYGVPRGRDVRVLSGVGSALGTKFLPGGFAPFAGAPLQSLTDRVVAAGDHFGVAVADLDGLYAVLRERVPKAVDPASALVNEVVARMRVAPPGARVEAFAADAGVSVRTLQRLFRRYVGVGPKWVLQRYRLHTALEALVPGERPDWARFAADLGYADQAHFITDFRTVVGRTPATFAAGA